MGLTKFPNGISSFGVPVLPGGLVTQGTCYFVKPYSGSDSNDGLTPDSALKTLSRAQTLATANQNDIVFLFSEHNTAASTTDYQSSTLTWAKNSVHLIGVNAGAKIGQRSRVAFTSTYATASNLFTLSANNCLIANVEFFAGVADTNPTGCFSLTGQRNRIENCQISGMGHANNDIASAYSLSIAGGSENIFKDCYIGLDTITLGAQINAQIYMSSAATRNIFEGCVFTTYTNHATNNQFLRVGSGGIDRFVIFKDCFFLNPSGTGMAGSTALTQAFTIHASAGGAVVLQNTSGYGFTDWNSADTTNVIISNAAPTAGTSGLALSVTR